MCFYLECVKCPLLYLIVTGMSWLSIETTNLTANRWHWKCSKHFLYLFCSIECNYFLKQMTIYIVKLKTKEHSERPYWRNSNIVARPLKILAFNNMKWCLNPLPCYNLLLCHSKMFYHHLLGFLKSVNSIGMCDVCIFWYHSPDYVILVE